MQASCVAPEVWGGLECTVVRIGDAYRDQLAETGHLKRHEDFEAVRSLGIKTLRYPVLWESTCSSFNKCDWAGHDWRLGRLRDLGIAPIAGLVHHGSGPLYTSLLDPNFPDLLAGHAGRVARRYPWIDYFTPVNEPLTTARFSCLYGHWYPHASDTRSFLQALLIQCRAVVLSMQVIRTVNPTAQLVQTDDLGKTFSTPLLRYQAEFENERRWLTFDLLCGRVDRLHPWHAYFLRHEIPADELAFFVEHPCPPDIIGINHYLTSERCLDEQLSAYPAEFHGGNGRHAYADIEAVRMSMPENSTGPAARLREAWERYRLPLAVTEAHHGSWRDDQVRWLSEVWSAACQVKKEGADIRAVTVWSLFGAVDWNSLLMRRSGFYEPGPFDIRARKLRRTALAAATASLTATQQFDHPILDRPGWWKRDSRYYEAPKRKRRLGMSGSPRCVAIVGARTSLGRAFVRLCKMRGIETIRIDAQSAAQSQDDLPTELRRLHVWAVIHAAGPPANGSTAKRSSSTQRDIDLLRGLWTDTCKGLGIPFVTFSSDHVFDGTLGRPYTESDLVHPVDPLGATMTGMENQVRSTFPDALIIRTGPTFGPWESQGFVQRVLGRLEGGINLQLSDQRIVSPTYLPDLVHATLDLLIDGETGLWHLANRGEASPYDLAREFAKRAKVGTRTLSRIDGPALNRSLTSERGLVLPPLDHGISSFLADCQPTWTQRMPTHSAS
jgi:dTDP-4-dehydrorhamnose reductase